MIEKPCAGKARTRAPAKSKAPGVRADARGLKEAARKQRNFTITTRRVPSRQSTLGNMAAPPLSGELHALLARGHSVADAPAEALASHPEVTSWHSVSGGVGRLSDHIHVLRSWLRANTSNRAIVSSGIAVTAGPRVQVVRSYWLAELVAVADLRQFALFDEEGVR